MHQSVKTKRTFFTEEKIANLRKNIQQFSWAKEQAAQIISKADYFLAIGIDTMIPWFMPQEIPRAYYVNQKYGCPNCGREMVRYRTNHWHMDFKNHP